MRFIPSCAWPGCPKHFNKKHVFVVKCCCVKLGGGKAWGRVSREMRSGQPLKGQVLESPSLRRQRLENPGLRGRGLESPFLRGRGLESPPLRRRGLESLCLRGRGLRSPVAARAPPAHSRHGATSPVLWQSSVAILAQGTHSGRCGNAGALRS